MESNNYEQAREYFERVLDMDATVAIAWFGLFRLECQNIDHMKPFAELSQRAKHYWSNVCKYGGDEEYITYYNGIREKIQSINAEHIECIIKDCLQKTNNWKKFTNAEKYLENSPIYNEIMEFGSEAQQARYLEYLKEYRSNRKKLDEYNRSSVSNDVQYSALRNKLLENEQQYEELPHVTEYTLFGLIISFLLCGMTAFFLVGNRIGLMNWIGEDLNIIIYSFFPVLVMYNFFLTLLKLRNRKMINTWLLDYGSISWGIAAVGMIVISQFLKPKLKIVALIMLLISIVTCIIRTVFYIYDNKVSEKSYCLYQEGQGLKRKIENRKKQWNEELWNSYKDFIDVEYRKERE